jgi:hypothetical protein
MKKQFLIIIVLFAFISCQEDVRFNNPSLQGLKDNVLWRAVDSRATIEANGSLTIKGYAQNEIVTLKASSVGSGTYVLGTTNQANLGSCALSNGAGGVEYKTIVVSGPVNKVTLSSGGSGYVEATSVAATGGTGSGLKVNIKVNTSGVVNQITISYQGNGYKAGDLITIIGGNGNAKFVVQNVSKSNGEIVITNYDGATISGTFKFNAVNTNTGSSNQVLNFQEGHFYKVPVN